MAKYVKISVRWNDYPKCLNRTFLFNINGTLRDLADAISYLIGATFEHPYEIKDRNCEYGLSEGYYDLGDTFLLDDYRLDEVDLMNNRTLYYWYDFGDDYIFKIHVGTKLFEKEGNQIAIPLKGYGVCIFEDDRMGLLDYCDNVELSEEEIPWNYKMTDNRDDFFRELTIQEMTKSISDLGSVDPIDEEDIDFSFYTNEKPQHYVLHLY